MEVLKRATTPDGVKIQIEDWSMNYSSHAPADTVATYPTAKQKIPGSKYNYPAPGESFRFAFKFKNAEEALRCFWQLENGVKTLRDFIGNLDNPQLAACI